MLNNLLSENQLKTITMEQFKKEYNQGINMKFTTDFSFDVLNDEEVGCLYDDSDVFRQGSCQLFALALQRRYNYQAYELENQGIHWYCKGPVGRDDLYIDVRGICDDIEIFTTTLMMPTITEDSSVKYCVEQDAPTREIDKLGLAFAEWIIQKNESRYKIE